MPVGQHQIQGRRHRRLCPQPRLHLLRGRHHRDRARDHHATDDFVHNLGYAFSEADTTKIAPEIIETFHKYNEVVPHRHLFYSTAYIHNNIHPEGTRVAVGFLGFVFSTVQYSDLLLDVEPVHKGYEQKLLDPTTLPTTPEEIDLGQNPNITEYHYQANPEN